VLILIANNFILLGVFLYGLRLDFSGFTQKKGDPGSLLVALSPRENQRIPAPPAAFYRAGAAKEFI